MTKLDRRALNRALLARQHLLARKETKPLKVIEDLVGLQAQQPKPPYVGLWSRVKGFKPELLSAHYRALEAVRVTAMRGTLHTMSGADYLGLRRCLQPGLNAGMKSILRDRLQGLDQPEVEAEARRFLGKGAKTFEEVRAHLIQRFPKGDERAMGFVVRMSLPLLMEPTTDRWTFPPDAAFALAEPKLKGKLAPSSGPEALILRYLAAFGPASVADAQAWSGLGGLKPSFEALRSKLVCFQDDKKRELFDLPEAPRPDGEAEAPLRFIADFDNLVLGHEDRRRIVDDAHRSQVVTKNLLVRATFLVDGFVAGIWSVAAKKKVATMTLTPFVKLSKKTLAGLEQEAAGLFSMLEPEATQTAVVLES
ncbi:MAG: winged helix DNA-binding domain-containing protein [Myxococcota bacterium]